MAVVSTVFRIHVTNHERTLVDVLDRPELTGSWEEILTAAELGGFRKNISVFPDDGPKAFCGNSAVTGFPAEVAFRLLLGNFISEN